MYGMPLPFPPPRVFQTQKSRAYVASNKPFVAAAETWRSAAEEYVFHDDREQDAFMKQHFPSLYGLWVALPLPVMKADVWRYAIVYHYGGVYADMDTVLHAGTLEPLLKAAYLVMVPEN